MKLLVSALERFELGLNIFKLSSKLESFTEGVLELRGHGLPLNMRSIRETLLKLCRLFNTHLKVLLDGDKSPIIIIDSLLIHLIHRGQVPDVLQYSERKPATSIAGTITSFLFELVQYLWELYLKESTISECLSFMSWNFGEFSLMTSMIMFTGFRRPRRSNSPSFTVQLLAI